MIKLYTSLKYFKTNEIIIDNESFFNNIQVQSLTEESLEVMKSIDNAVLLDRNTGKIETPFGIANISDLSTGCKTVLNIIYNSENPEAFPTIKAINATECGSNALEAVFSIIEKHNIDLSVVLEHDDNVFNCSKRDYLINNKEVVDHLVFLLTYKEDDI